MQSFRWSAIVLAGALLGAAALGSWWSRERIARFLSARRTSAILADVAGASAYRSVDPRLSREDLPYKPLAPFPRSDTRRIPAAALRVIAAAIEDPTPESLHAAGVLLLLAGRWNEAVALLERASDHSRAGTADVLSDLATAYYERGRDRRSVPDLTLAFSASARAIELDATTPTPWSVRALVLEELALRDDAAEAWNAYLARDPRSPWAAEARERLRVLSEMRPAPRQARTFVEEDLLGAWGDALLRGDLDHATKTLAEAGTAANRVAVDHTDRTALHAFERIEREAGNRTSTQRLATAHTAYRDARRLMERARDAQARDALRSAARQLAEARSPLAHRATVHAATITHYLGANEEADAMLASVLDELRGREHEYPVVVGQALWIRALIAVARRRPHDALQLAQRARLTLEPVREPSSLAGIDTVLADIHRYLGNTREAWEHRLLAFRALDRNAPYMRRQLLLAETARTATNAGQLALARVLVRRMSLNASRERDSVFTARALLSESEILRASAPPDEAGALQRLDRAWLVLHSRPVSGSTGRYVADIAIARAELLVRRDPAAAGALLENAIAQLDALGHRSRFSRIHLLLGRAREAVEDSGGAERAYLRGIEQFEAERATVPLDQQRSVFADTGRPLYEAAVRALLARGAEAEALSVVRRARGAAATIEPRNGDVLIEYFVQPDGLLAWTTARGVTHMRRTRISPARLAALVERHGNAVRESRPSGPALFELLLTGGIPDQARVTIAPDAVLHRVPFASLQDRAGQFATERFVLTVALGSSPPSSDAPYRSALVVAAPAGADDLAPLAAVRREVELVARSFPTHMKLDGETATRERFLDEAAKHDVVHFAGHAFADEQQPAFASLRLGPANGAVYAYEIESRRFAHTRLVVLSACDTAAGRLSDSGALSFARAFTAAGVPRVIGSLWKVDDRATAKLFASFYAALRGGATPEEALRDAQREAIASKDRHDPAAWAAFQLYASDLH